jgi:diguanylate cyclase (GGDEF)-like protein
MINLQKKLLSIKVKFLIFLIVTLFVALSIITLLFDIGYSMSSKYAPLVDASMEIKLEATTAHLWLEEILSGDTKEDINEVRQNIKNAIWYANAMINGGQNDEGTYLPLENKNLENKIKYVLLKLQEFENMTNQRYANKSFNIAGDKYDILYDKVFREFIAEADIVEIELQKIILKEQEIYKLVYYVLFITTTLMIFIYYILLYFYQKEKIKITDILKEEVIHDSLTGLYNRRYYDEIIKKELIRSKRDKVFFTFVILDIDYFKRYNDTYGHQEGDNVLKAVAEVLKKNLNRCGDYCFRLGGEEFGFLFTGKSADESYRFSNMICKEIENLCIPHSKNEASKYLTASFGILNTNIESSSVQEDAIYLAADKALYKAKEDGRNCVVITCISS